jgi:hypothetical protein
MEEEEVIVLDDFEAAKREVAELQREHDQAVGALRQVRKNVVAEFGVKDGVQLKKKVNELTQEELAIADEWNRKYAAWRKKWAHVLKKREEPDDE